MDAFILGTSKGKTAVDGVCFTRGVPAFHELRMSRPVLSICTRCEPSGKHRSDDKGASLHDRVREVRKQRGLKEVFKVEAVDCLGLCDEPCVVELKGKQRSTYTRVGVDTRRDVEAVVEMACAYAAMPPGGELPERGLPGQHAD